MLSYELRAASPNAALLSLLLGFMEPNECAHLTIDAKNTTHARLFVQLDTQRNKMDDLVFDSLLNGGYAPLPVIKEDHPLDCCYAIVRQIGENGSYGVLQDEINFSQMFSALFSVKTHVRFTLHLRVLRPLLRQQLLAAQTQEEKLLRFSGRSKATTDYYQKEPAAVEMMMMISGENDEETRNLSTIIAAASKSVEMEIVPLARGNMLDRVKNIKAYYMRRGHRDASYLTHALWYSRCEMDFLEKGLSLSLLFPNIPPEAILRTNVDPVYRKDAKSDFIPLGMHGKTIVGISMMEPNRGGMVVLGKPGAGKTNLLLQWMKLCSEKEACIIFITPIKRDGRKLDPENLEIHTICGTQAPLYLNIVRPLNEKTTMKQHRDLLVQTLVEAFCSGDPESNSTMTRILNDAVDRLLLQAGYQLPDFQTVNDGNASMLTMPNLFESITKCMGMRHYKDEIGEHLLTILRSHLHEVAHLPCFECDHHSIQLDEILYPGKISVFEMEDITSDYGKKLVAITVINNLIKNIEMMEHDYPIFLVLDEAHVLLQDNQNAPTPFLFKLSRYMREDRARKIGFVLAEQSPDALTPQIIDNCSSLISFTCEDSKKLLSGSLFNSEPLLPLNSLPSKWAYLKNQGKNAIIFIADKHKDNQDTTGIFHRNCDFLPFNGCERYCTACIPEKKKEGLMCAGKLHYVFLKLIDQDKKKGPETAARNVLEILKNDSRLNHCAHCHLCRELVRYGVPVHLFDMNQENT